MLAPLLGIKETVPVVATALIISNIARIWAFRKSVAVKEYLAVFLTGLPFIVLKRLCLCVSTGRGRRFGVGSVLIGLDPSQ